MEGKKNISEEEEEEEEEEGVTIEEDEEEEAPWHSREKRKRNSLIKAETQRRSFNFKEKRKMRTKS